MPKSAERLPAQHAARAADFIAKPINDSALLEAVRAVCGTPVNIVNWSQVVDRKKGHLAKSGDTLSPDSLRAVAKREDAEAAIALVRRYYDLFNERRFDDAARLISSDASFIHRNLCGLMIICHHWMAAGAVTSGGTVRRWRTMIAAVMGEPQRRAEDRP